jgi:predicted dienelactone hydrolase
MAVGFRAVFARPEFASSSSEVNERASNEPSLYKSMQSKSRGYDPAAVDPSSAVHYVDFSVNDPDRRRILPLRVYLPNIKTPAPIILFSHGLGGTCRGSAFLGEHWAKRGYLCVFVQHPGSDDSVWHDLPLFERLAAMKKAASAQNFMLRVKDIPVVLDQLAAWNRDPAHLLNKRLDLAHVGMSGHSFGAVTTQALCGQSFSARGSIFTDARIKAAIAMSPSSPRGGNADAAFSGVRIPWLLMTGTRDVAPIGDADLSSRLAVFPALPPGDKYELVLYDAEHSAFSDRALPGDSSPRNPNHHRAIVALSTAFWDAYLLRNEAALKWLAGGEPRMVLEPKDRWQRK